MKKVNYTVDEIRDLVAEYWFLRDDILEDPESGDSEEGENELNMFLRWLGAKKPIANRIGWDNVKKECIGKRKMDPKKLKELTKSLKPEDLWRKKQSTTHG